MRILTLSYEFPPVGGGGARVVEELSKELVRRRHRVDVVTMGFRGKVGEEALDGMRVYRLDCARKSAANCTPREAFRYLTAARGLVARLLDENAYDVVHVHFILPTGVLAALEARKRGVPYVITAHGSDVPGYNEKLFFRTMHPLLSPLRRWVTRNAAEIVSPSHELERLILRSRPKTKVSVIPNAIDPDRFRPRPKRDRILIATRLVRRKGVRYVLRALAGMSSDHEVLIVGDGEDRAELERLNNELGRPASFRGWLDNGSPEFRDLLETSSIYALPSDYENFPICLLEAMAAGTAIITTRGHGCEEVVGDTGELVTPGRMNEAACVEEIRAAILRLTSDRERCRRLGESARERLEEKFTWSRVAGRYYAVYEAHAR